MGVVDITPKAKNAVSKKSERARSTLRWVALFLGELRDGLTMINMQSAFLIVSKNYSEKQVGILFFIFGMSQFLFQTPAGYLMDYSEKKVLWLAAASIATTSLTILTATTAQENGGNLLFMVLVKFVQGAVTAMIPPGLNSITQGIVGAVGMTQQVSKNEMMNHLGTAIIVLSGSLIAFFLFPDIGFLFVVSPIACAGVLFFLSRIRPEDIDHNAARGLTLETTPLTSDSSSLPSIKASAGDSPYKSPAGETEAVTPQNKGRKPKIQTKPSFNFGFGQSDAASVMTDTPKADTPLQVIRDPLLLTFIVIVFLFHTSNGTVLPLVMQSLAIGNGRTGILMSGMCIIVAQLFMVLSAKICGDYSLKYGRKTLFLIGLFTVPVRCFILTILLGIKGDGGASTLMQVLILSTQILDGVGAGTFGTMYILVTSDISGGTGRFSLTLGLTTAAMSIGGTVSGYLGQALAEDIGYREAFIILGFMALVPALTYLFCMPETLPDHSKKSQQIDQMASIIEEEEHETEGDGNERTKGTNYVEMV